MARLSRSSPTCARAARVSLAAFIDAVVIVDPVQYQRRRDERVLDFLEELRQQMPVPDRACRSPRIARPLRLEPSSPRKILANVGVGRPPHGVLDGLGRVRGIEDGDAVGHRGAYDGLGEHRRRCPQIAYHGQ